MSPAPNVAPFQIIAGAADVYVASTGTAFPAVNVDPGTAWRKLGHTDGGINVRHTQTVVELRTDQTTAPVKAVRTEEGLEIGFSLAEVTPANYALALNHASSPHADDGSGNKVVALYRGGFAVETVAMLVRGQHLSPQGDFNLQYEVPSVHQSGAPDVAYTKDAKALLICAFNAVGAGAFNPGFSDDDIFGVLRVGTA
jgi:hypothetical protein